MTVQNLYDVITRRLLENGGFQTSTVTDAQFLDYFSDVLVDFLVRTGISKAIFTQTILAGVSQYRVPDRIVRVEECFVAGIWIQRTTREDLDNGVYQWRRKTDIPRMWHEDGLAIKTLELVPTPNYNGVAYAVGTNGIPGQYDDFFVADRNLTIVGTQKPSQTSFALTDTIPLVPDTAVPYVGWGVLHKIFSSDSEAKDAQRAAYCGARAIEGLRLFRSAMVERLQEDYDTVAEF